MGDVTLNKQLDTDWPPAPGDFEVKDPQSCIGICTLGKKIDVPSNYAIIGTCKTENIGIERVIINIISNSNIRFLILAGPEVPGTYVLAVLAKRNVELIEAFAIGLDINEELKQVSGASTRD